MNRPPSRPKPSRRRFLKQSALATAVFGTMPVARGAHAAGSDLLRVGLVGCGGRGTGAAANALKADPNTRLVAMADVFGDKIEGSLARLKARAVEQVDVDKDHQFVGFDAHLKLIDCVDVVLLATPSHFHPLHLKAAVEAGRHVFVEKPHGVDPTQVRMVRDACEEAARKNLCVVSGLCWRYDLGAKETMKRVQEGAIGDVMSAEVRYMTSFSRTRPRVAGQTEMQHQMDNWYNFAWLSGCLPGLTMIHSVDKGSWAFGDVPPVRAWGIGGRQVRTEPVYGDVYDHHTLVYEYEDGRRIYAYGRQGTDCYRSVADQITGTKGLGDLMNSRIAGETKWRYRGPKTSKHQEEHNELFKAIRRGTPINNGNYMVLSTMLVVMGRMASYTGQSITWDDAMNSTLDLSPSEYSWNGVPPTLPDAEGRYPIAMPGITKYT